MKITKNDQIKTIINMNLIIFTNKVAAETTAVAPETTAVATETAIISY